MQRLISSYLLNYLILFIGEIMSVAKKIKRKLLNSVQAFKDDSKFSVYYALLRVLSEYTRSLHLRKMAFVFQKKREKWILNYLKSAISPAIDEFKHITTSGNTVENAPIWISWWTGEETAPPLVKQCIKSIYKNANNHPVIFITKDNFNEYISVPDYILSKAENGKMKLAHLCDYVRIALLEKYGGLWLDTTIFCSNKIPNDYFSLPFFTGKSEADENCPYISKMRWVTFILGGYQNNVFFSFLKKSFELYWSKNDTAIDYLFFDCLIELAYQNIPEIKRLIDNVPLNNLRRDDLQAAMNDRLPANKFYSVAKPDTVLYKLSWRESYSEETTDGKPSVYKYFLNL